MDEFDFVSSGVGSRSSTDEEMLFKDKKKRKHKRSKTIKKNKKKHKHKRSKTKKKNTKSTDKNNVSTRKKKHKHYKKVRTRMQYEDNIHNTQGKKIIVDKDPHCPKKAKTEEESDKKAKTEEESDKEAQAEQESDKEAQAEQEPDKEAQAEQESHQEAQADQDSDEEKSKGIETGDTRKAQGMTLICAYGHPRLWTKASFFCPIRDMIDPETNKSYNCAAMAYGSLTRHIWAHQARGDAPEIMKKLPVKNAGVICRGPDCVGKKAIFYEKRTWMNHRRTCLDHIAGKIPRQRKKPGWWNCEITPLKKTKSKRSK